ncbi:TFIIB-type zinc ribbon-containing protein [Sporomusa sphaeroides]|uniref:DUF4145 domain-containing protein n=1 Tax=Sporomusa sphaeroides DSM 2875 TaxID=1337886 RepID=A0ABM9W2B4_9FIRM|nr:TFIIB-type zinc ribbon-containing protein [Sporomusa sphaeroides]OLS56147.1 hypothetical protein SPSPH_25360 [Sporomusa sphaeroides DSM 2875]CVK19211.1 hypothetical protein SSPH_01860 [Sporomusa sphaeroides DSM 2875]
MQYTVFENGLDFILSAINNLSVANEGAIDEAEKKRLIKYALLHLSSGIELVFKHHLLQENWTYVFADMNKARKKDLETGDLKSADSETIIGRLENLCDINLNESDKRCLKNLRGRRNKAEHFKLDENILSIESSIHKSISILIKFIAEHYDIEEFSEEERQLFFEIKDAMRGLTQHYDDAKLLARKELEQSGESAIICPECKEKFLVIDGGSVKCCFCKYEDSGESAAEDYVNNVLGMDAYSTIKDGGEYPLYTCLECGCESFVFDYEKGTAICFSCGHQCDIDELSFCSCCGALLYNHADCIEICSDCLDYKINKDD